MQLKKLEAYGFKSFADKLELDFDGGITAIVGPNGSGKSNITDAIRWVLGEQNVRNLRGVKTEDIIFSGSHSRRALGVAEVSLLFDNRDGTLPVDFQEVHITRRIFRSGESEYYINKTQCRLKDIHNLFADTGLGRDAMSVISQNKIDQILNSRAEDRRMFFEEAAGITKYRNRKKESLKKLEDTNQNLLRVEDILTELEGRLEPLALSAQRTKAYNEYQDSLKSCRITLLLNDYEKYEAFLKEARVKKDGLLKEQDNISIDVTLKETQITQLNNELLEVERSLQILQAKGNELNGAHEKERSNLLVFQERRQQGDKESQRDEKEIGQFTMRKQSLEVKLTDLAVELTDLDTRCAFLNGQVRGVEEQELKLDDDIRATQAQLETMRQKSYEQIAAAHNAENTLQFMLADGERIKSLLETKQSERMEQQEKCGRADDQQHFLSMERMKLAELLSLTQEKEAKFIAYNLDLDRQLEQLHLELNRTEGLMGKTQSRKTVLASMQKEYEGFGRAVKSVLKSKHSWRNGICGAVAELLKVPSTYITAVDIALGGSQQHIVAEAAEHAKAAIEYLKREKLGRATFLPLNHIKSFKVNTPPPAILQAKGYIGLAHELIAYDEKYAKVAEFLLSRTLIVEDLDSALGIAKEQGFKWRIVTLDGELLTPGGAMSGGSHARGEVNFFNRGNEIAILQTELEKLTSRKLELTAVQQKLAKNFAELKAERSENFQKQQSYQEKLNKIKFYEEKNAQEISELKQRLVLLGDTIAQQKTEEETLKAHIFDCQHNIEKLKTQSTSDQTGNEELAVLLDERRTRRETLRAEATELKIALGAANQERSLRLRLHDEAKQALVECAEELQTLHDRLQALQLEMCELDENIRASESSMAHLSQLRNIAEKDYGNFYQIKLEKLALIQDNDKDLKNLRKKSADLREFLHQADLFYTKYEYEADHCRQKLQDEYALSIESASLKRLSEDSAALKKLLQEYETKLAEIGPVNPNAIAEYEELGQRYEFLQQQSADLIKAKDYLSGIIRDMDDTMSKQFIQAFEKMNQYFAEVCQRLFGGGQARLELLDRANILESGIEIHVQPPEKKMQNLTLLSGGERALTVIGLLFAFLKYRPAPFTVVDEIDAALDEANLDRFSDFLKEYAKETQFIVVTHRKGTMQAADIMHGVTVEDTGVSRIVSVRLEDSDTYAHSVK